MASASHLINELHRFNFIDLLGNLWGVFRNIIDFDLLFGLTLRPVALLSISTTLLLLFYHNLAIPQCWGRYVSIIGYFSRLLHSFDWRFGSLFLVLI